MTENEAISRIKDHMEIHRLKEPRAIYITVALSMAITALKEVQQYREIGTVEECRKAVEKQEPKNPEIYTDTVQTINGSFQRDVFECPVCGEYICNVEDEIPRYCSSCGQKLEESEE